MRIIDNAGVFIGLFINKLCPTSAGSRLLVSRDMCHYTISYEGRRTPDTNRKSSFVTTLCQH